MAEFLTAAYTSSLLKKSRLVAFRGSLVGFRAVLCDLRMAVFLPCAYWNEPDDGSSGAGGKQLGYSHEIVGDDPEGKGSFPEPALL